MDLIYDATSSITGIARQRYTPFVVSGEVVYIGKSIVPLAKRIGHYGKPVSSQFTNLRVNARIRKALSEEQAVGLWVLVDWESFHHRGIPVNVAAGIEDALIQRLAPPWNGGNRTKPGIPLANELLDPT